MGRYTEAQSDVFSVFGSAKWQQEAIKTYPSDMVADSPGASYLRVAVICSGKGINRISISGVCIIDIFTAYGQGPNEAMTIADKLDDYLQDKTVGNVQFGESTVLVKGQDPANSTLTKSSYTIPFNLYKAE